MVATRFPRWVRDKYSLQPGKHEETSLPRGDASHREYAVRCVRMSRHLWTLANAVMLLAFAFSVVVQFNDPDPFLWATIYTAATLVCAFELRRRVDVLVPAGIAAVAVTWAVTIAPRVLGHVPFTAMFAEFEMANTAIEESREMYGLALIAIWMVAVAAAAWRRRTLKQSR